MVKRLWIIANPIAGGRKDAPDLIARVSNHFEQNGFDKRLRLTTRAGDAKKFTNEARQNAADLVVVVGGDGTINEVASALVQSDVQMGIIPVGSGNGLARSLSIPTNIEAACQLVHDGQATAIDVGRVNDRYFFLVVGIGFDAAVGKSFNAHHKRGALPYFYLGAKEYMRYSPEELQVSFGAQAMSLRPFLLAVANGQQYGNNAIIAPQAKLNDGLLDLCIVHTLTVPQLFSAVPKLFKGELMKYSQAEFYQAPAVKIVRPAADYINLDGESVLEKATIEITTIPKCLKVITPKKSASLV